MVYCLCWGWRVPVGLTGLLCSDAGVKVAGAGWLPERGGGKGRKRMWRAFFPTGLGEDEIRVQ